MLDNPTLDHLVHSLSTPVLKHLGFLRLLLRYRTGSDIKMLRNSSSVVRKWMVALLDDLDQNRRFLWLEEDDQSPFGCL
jgi:hypothetical protein